MNYKLVMLLVVLLLAISTLGAVSASENLTSDIIQDSNMKILGDDTIQKEDLDVKIVYSDYLVYNQPFDGPELSFKNVPQDYDCNVGLYIDGEYDRVIGAHQSSEISTTDLAVGKHNITAMFPETAKYNPINITHKFNMESSHITISDEITEKDGVSLEFSKGATGIFSVYVDGKLYKKFDVSKYSYRAPIMVGVEGFEYGKHTIEAKFSKDNNYKKAVSTVTFYIDMNCVAEAIFNGNMLYGREENSIGFYLPEDVTSKPIVTIAGEKYDYVKDGNYYNVYCRYAPVGKSKVVVTYPGDKKYPKRTIEGEISVIAAIQNEYYFINNSTVATLSLPNDAKGNLTIYINGKLHTTSPIKDYTAEVFLNLTKLGTYEFRFAYEGDDYPVEEIILNKTVNPYSIYNDHVYEGEDESVLLLFPDNFTGNITYYFDYDFSHGQVLPVENGSVSFKIPYCKVSGDEYSHCVTIQVSVNSIDYNASLWYSVYVLPQSHKIRQDSVTSYYSQSTTFSVHIFPKVLQSAGAGESVKVKIGNKVFNLKTNSKGEVSVNIKTFLPKTYAVTTTYKGIVKKSKIIIKQPLSLKTVSVKRSAKSLTLQATLKTTKALKNKQVKFKFNGKTYKAKTNSKGIAKVTIKSNVLKKLKVGKKVTYQVTYLEDTVKKTARIKR